MKIEKNNDVSIKEEYRANIERLSKLVGKKLVSLQWHMRRFFGPCLPMLKDARVLDIGCGKGTTTFYAAICGAREVVGLEPEAAGSTSGSIQTFLKIREELGLAQCEHKPIDFMVYSTETPFDLVLLYNSINHIREVSSDIRRDNVARQSQNQVIAQIAKMIKVNGWVILCDASRRNFFADLRLPSPFSRTVNRKVHQSPGAWRRLLAEHGFGDFSQNWYVPYIIPWARVLLDNTVINYLTFSRFVLRARKIR
ncbi:MAG: class I SAM-dependent methyltransferase [Planctomycetota bacterium]|jgi:SAM-dependent methyltransferase